MIYYIYNTPTRGVEFHKKHKKYILNNFKELQTTFWKILSLNFSRFYFSFFTNFNLIPCGSKSF